MFRVYKSFSPTQYFTVSDDDEVQIGEEEKGEFADCECLGEFETFGEAYNKILAD